MSTEISAALANIADALAALAEKVDALEASAKRRRVSEYKAPCTIDGVDYESQSAAARATGIPQNEISVMHRNGVLHLLKPRKSEA